MYAYVTLVCLVLSEAIRGHKIPLELELLIAVSHRVGAKIKPVSSVRTAIALKH